MNDKGPAVYFTMNEAAKILKKSRQQVWTYITKLDDDKENTIFGKLICCKIKDNDSCVIGIFILMTLTILSKGLELVKCFIDLAVERWIIMM